MEISPRRLENTRRYLMGRNYIHREHKRSEGERNQTYLQTSGGYKTAEQQLDERGPTIYRARIQADIVELKEERK